MTGVWWLGVVLLIGTVAGAGNQSKTCERRAHTQPGACYNLEKTWTFNPDTQECDVITTGGCTAADNIFETLEDCHSTCLPDNQRKAARKSCEARHDSRPGACYNLEKTWTYNPETRQCDEITRGGCTAADNVFETLKECQDTCVSEKPGRCPLSGRNPATCQERPNECTVDNDCQGTSKCCHNGCGRLCVEVRAPEKPGRCPLSGRNPATCQERPNECRVDSDCQGASKCCHNGCGRLCTEVRTRGGSRNQNRYGRKQFDADRDCALPAVTGRCRARKVRYYLREETGQCERFIYGGCNGNNNNFVTKAACERNCAAFLKSDKSARDICLLHKDSGPCEGIFKRFYYDSQHKECKEFTYGGCGGTENNFETEEQCEQRCHHRIEDRATSKQQQPPRVSHHQQRGNPICNLPKQPGPCEAIFPRFYYNRMTRRCEDFVYGGCQGNENNFEDRDSCEQACYGNSHVQRIAPQGRGGPGNLY